MALACLSLGGAVITGGKSPVGRPDIVVHICQYVCHAKDIVPNDR